MSSPRVLWPNLDEGYTDEFGAVDPDVYRAAGDLWPRAEKFIGSTMHDAAAGLRLMLKAAALVSRKQRQQPELIYELKGYLWTTFERLALAELKRESRHQSLDADPQADGHPTLESLDDYILLREIVSQMDDWTRAVFELRVFGYEFEEIARMLNTPSNRLRSRFSKEIKKLTRLNR